MWGNYQNHFLPFRGAPCEQPCFVSEALALFSRAENERLAAENEAQKHKASGGLTRRGG
jgi:hypothetical protein